MVSVVHICSDCLISMLLFSHTQRTQCPQSPVWFQKTVAGRRNPRRAHLFLDDCVCVVSMVLLATPESNLECVYTERNVQVSVYKCWQEEMAIHQCTSFLETCLLPLLHRSAWPVGSLLSPIRGAQKLDDDIAFQGWALPVRDTSLLWYCRQIPRRTSSRYTV